jgi:hypothetical protein
MPQKQLVRPIYGPVPPIEKLFLRMEKFEFCSGQRGMLARPKHAIVQLGIQEGCHFGTLFVFIIICFITISIIIAYHCLYCRPIYESKPVL